MEGADKPHSKEEAEEWRRAANALAAQMRSKQGLEIGPCHLVLHVRPCEGLMRQLDGTVEKRFSKAQMTYPIQVGCCLPPRLLARLLSGAASGAAEHATCMAGLDTSGGGAIPPLSGIPCSLSPSEYSDCLPYAHVSLFVQPNSMPFAKPCGAACGERLL